MKILALDTSTDVASVAVLSEERLICENMVNYQRKHSEKLIPTLNLMMENSGLSYADIDYFAATVGPGSFTGLRIGLATAKGLAQAADKPIIPVSTLEALAYNLLYSKGLICPMLDARREQIYTALFRTDGTGRLTRVTADTAVAPMDFAAVIQEKRLPDEALYFLGDALGAYAGVMTEACGGRCVAPYDALGRGASTAACALSHVADAQDLRVVAPVYLRPSYAEEKKK